METTSKSKSGNRPQEKGASSIYCSELMTHLNVPYWIEDLAEWMRLNKEGEDIPSLFGSITLTDLKTWIGIYCEKYSLKEIDFYKDFINNIFQIIPLLDEARSIYIKEYFNKQKQDIISLKKEVYTVKEVVAMSNTFGIRTENTVGKYLKDGIIKGKNINGKWQISREALREYIGHDNF